MSPEQQAAVAKLGRIAGGQSFHSHDLWQLAQTLGDLIASLVAQNDAAEAGRLAAEARWAEVESFEALTVALLKGEHSYRIEKIEGGFEAQHLYTAGQTKRSVWFPLNENGYWAEPDAFTSGSVSKRHPMATEALAYRAILRARHINGQRPLLIPPTEASGSAPDA